MEFEIGDTVSIRLTFNFSEDSNETRGILRNSTSDGVFIEIEEDVNCLYFFPMDKILFLEKFVVSEESE